jgi:hypothetical protein
VPIWRAGIMMKDRVLNAVVAVLAFVLPVWCIFRLIMLTLSGAGL